MKDKNFFIFSFLYCITLKNFPPALLAFVSFDGFDDAAVRAQIFVKQNLRTIDEHLVSRAVQFLAELNQGERLALGLASLQRLGGLQIKNVFERHIIAAVGINDAEYQPWPLDKKTAL